MSTPLPPIDGEQVASFWARASEAGAVASDTSMPTSVGPFGDSVELADELIALVVEGPKRATAGALAAYEYHGDPLPEVGGLSIATDGAGQAHALLRTTEVRIGPLSSVDDQFAWDEGEGDRTRDDWLRAHTAYFERVLQKLGVQFDADLPTVFERFELVYGEGAVSST